MATVTMTMTSNVRYPMINSCRKPKPKLIQYKTIIVQGVTLQEVEAEASLAGVGVYFVALTVANRQTDSLVCLLLGTALGLSLKTSISSPSPSRTPNIQPTT